MAASNLAWSTMSGAKAISDDCEAFSKTTSIESERLFWCGVFCGVPFRSPPKGYSVDRVDRPACCIVKASRQMRVIGRTGLLES